MVRVTKHACVGAGLGVVLWAGAVAAGDWPGWRGESRRGFGRTGLCGMAGRRTALAWKASGLGSGLAGVAVVGDRLHQGDEGRPGTSCSTGRTARSSGRRRWARRGRTCGGARSLSVDGDLVFAIGTEDLVCPTATGAVR
jgi:hypothetical protein